MNALARNPTSLPQSIGSEDPPPANLSAAWSEVSGHADPAHKSVGRTLVYALTLGMAEAWAGLSTVLRARLSDQERACLAMVATAASDEPGAGWPIPPFVDSVMAEARIWACYASNAELKAYTAVGYETLSACDQARFLRHVERRAAA